MIYDNLDLNNKITIKMTGDAFYVTFSFNTNDLFLYR